MFSKTQGKELRRHPRYEGVLANYAAFNGFVDRQSAVYKPVFARNFSLGGICLNLGEKFDRQDHLIIRLYEPYNNNPIEALGRIVWIKAAHDFPAYNNHYDMGVKIIFIDETNHARLQHMAQHYESLIRK
ncbi:MAG TPA: PilZ domain-containing protein [Candidatus Omnitrophota bacterium]|nr:PilZ domain-containing protein [Candidatus Omnitrophota bacterium]